MDTFENVVLIHSFLESLNSSSDPLSILEALNKELSNEQNNEPKFDYIRQFTEKHRLVERTNWESDDDFFKDIKYIISSIGRQLLKEGNLTTFIVAEDFKAENPEIYDEKIWEDYFDEKIEKRANQADFFFDIIIAEKIIPLGKPEIRKYFKEWFKETQTFDLQIKNGDLAIEDGDLQIIPDFDKSNIPEFINWFEEKKEDFINYLKEHGITPKNEIKKQIINNTGNLIINEQSKIKKQSIEAEKTAESNWTKANVIIALIVGVVTVIGFILSLKDH